MYKEHNHTSDDDHDIRDALDTMEAAPGQIIYRVIGNSSPKVIAYCSQNMKIMDFLTPLEAPQMWSI